MKALFLLLVLCLLGGAFFWFSRGNDPAPPGKAAFADELPEGWETQSLSEFLNTFDTAVAGELSEESLISLSDHVFSLLGDLAFVASAEGEDLMALVRRMTEHLAPWYTEARQEAVTTAIETRLQADTALSRTGGFLEVSGGVWDPALRAGVDRSEIAGHAKAWAVANDASSLSPEETAKLVNALEDDLVPVSQFAMRWTGTLSVPEAGDYSFSLYQKGGTAKVYLDENLIVDSTAGSESPPIPLHPANGAALRVEYVFDAASSHEADPMPEWVKAHRVGWAEFVLRWTPPGGEEEVLPGSALTPAGGLEGPGVRAEVFDGQDFSGTPAQVRVDPEVAALILHTESRDEVRPLSSGVELVRAGASPASAERALQRSLASGVARSLQDSMFLAGPDKAQLIWASWALVEYLPMSEKRSVLSTILATPEILDSLPVDELFHFQKAHRHVDRDLVDDLIVAWCSRTDELPTRFGAYPDWEDHSGGYMHQNYGGYWHMAPYLSEDEQVARLESALEGRDGVCNQRLAKLLAFAHLERGSLQDWCTRLDERIEETAGDVQVTWLFARAFSEELKSGRGPNLIAGQDWLDQAFAVANSESVRLRALEELVVRLGSGGYSTEADSLISSVEQQFSAQAALFDGWRSEISRLSEHYIALQEAAKEEKSVQHLAELKRRLEAAQAAERPRSVERYQRLLSRYMSE